MANKTIIIAEAGVNHNGSLDLARRLIDAATDAGADMVKFQTFKAGNLVSKRAQKAEYQKINTSTGESQFEMLRKLELDEYAHKELIAWCRQRNIRFFSTPFDHDSIALLDRLGMEVFKIPSGDITNLPYLRKIGGLGREVILSSGMADLGEIEHALNVLENAGIFRQKITVLHCNTEYPTPMSDVNLRAMLTIKAAFPGIKVGYSDHTPGIEVPIAAVALGASIVEKHFTLDRSLPGPDHKASLEPIELTAMVTAIRNIEQAMGDGIKRPSPSEMKNKAIARKSIVAACPIRKGETFTEQNLAVKRPGTGLSPMRWNEVIGQVAKKNYKIDELI